MARKTPTAGQIVRYGKVVLSHHYGRSIWVEHDEVYKWRDHYATSTEGEINGPFATLDEAAGAALQPLFTVTSGSTDIDCTELSAQELARRLAWDWMEDGFDLSLNGEAWVFQGEGFRRAPAGGTDPGGADERDILRD